MCLVISASASQLLSRESDHLVSLSSSRTTTVQKRDGLWPTYIKRIYEAH